MNKNRTLTPAVPQIKNIRLKRSDFEEMIQEVKLYPNKKEPEEMQTIYHEAASRGHANHGWLKTYHSFSFANYFNPERMNFGVLRVLNDDTIDGGTGFGTHPHDNMEIISIPLKGDLEHKDSMGNTAVIKEGDIQVMSAGTGVFHSEYNANKDKAGSFLQIWVFPNKKNVSPRYDQITLKNEDLKNQFHQILSPNQDDEGVWIHQNAWFHLGEFENEKTTTYQIKDNTNGVYVFVIEGALKIGKQTLHKRDGFGIYETDAFDVEIIEENTKILLMEVPMSL